MFSLLWKIACVISESNLISVYAYFMKNKIEYNITYSINQEHFSFKPYLNYKAHF